RLTRLRRDRLWRLPRWVLRQRTASRAMTTAAWWPVGAITSRPWFRAMGRSGWPPSIYPMRLEPRSLIGARSCSGICLEVDRGAASILNDFSETELGAEEQTVHLPKEVLEFVRNRKPADLSSGEAHFRTDKHEYVCRAYLVEPRNGVLPQPVLVLHFQRAGSASDAVHKVASEFRLTDREHEVLRGISLGLTSK